MQTVVLVLGAMALLCVMVLVCGLIVLVWDEIRRRKE